MPQFLFPFILLLLFSASSHAGDAAFANHYQIDVEALLVSAPNSRKSQRPKAIDLSISIIGENGIIIPLKDYYLGQIPLNQLVEAGYEDPIKIFDNDLRAALSSDGILAKRIKHPRLHFKITSYRTLFDETHIQFSIPIEEINKFPNQAQRLSVTSQKQNNFLRLQLTPVYF